MAVLVVFVMVASLSAAGCVINPSSHFASRFTPNKWVGFSLDTINEQLTPDMLAYMETNHWGLWLETPPLWAGASDYSGNNNVNTSLTEFKTEVGPLLANIQNNYHIPVMINLAEITDRWSWGDTQANTSTHSAVWYEANFGPIFDYMETWANGQNGNCLTTYWYKAGWPTFAEWLRDRTTLQIHWELPGWENYIGSTCGHDNLTNPRGSWITGYGPTEQVPIAKRFSLVDEVDIEIWWTGEVPTQLDGIRYIKSCYPNMPIGIDSQDQGGFNINLWGSAYGLTDHPTNYSDQRADYRLYIGQLKTALGKPFDTLMAEFAGDSGNIPNQAGWTESQIIQDQLQYELNSGWVSLTPTPMQTATPTPTPMPV